MHKWQKGIIALIVLLLLTMGSSPAPAEENLTEHPRVKEALNLLKIWIEAEVEYKRIPGFSIAVVHDQDVVWSAGFGHANIEGKVAAQDDTIFSICSISKLFTSISIMQLRDAGKLQLDDPLSKHIPWFSIKKTHPDAPPITIRSVLSHSSGLPRESAQPYNGEPDLPWEPRPEIMKALPNQETLYEPDKYFQYSNLGMSLLGEVVANVSGMSYGEYIGENILKPLGMADTTPFLPEDKLGKRLAVGYSRWPRQGEREPLNFFQANGATPAAGLASTALDLAKFASWQFRVLNDKDNAILNHYTLKEMHRIHWTDPDWQTKWGLGFATWRNKDVTFVGHGGGCPGYRTHLAIAPEKDIAVICMSNATDISIGNFTEKGYSIIAPALAEALKDKGKEEEKEAAEASMDLDKYIGSYRAFWADIAMIPWKGKLGMVFLPSSSPADSVTELKHIEGNVFRMVRKDGELGEWMKFEMDETGKVFRVNWASFYFFPVEKK